VASCGTSMELRQASSLIRCSQVVTESGRPLAISFDQSRSGNRQNVQGERKIALAGNESLIYELCGQTAQRNAVNTLLLRSQSSRDFFRIFTESDGARTRQSFSVNPRNV